ncbi:PQQ-dependent sugar dehydrogenase [Sphingomonas sp.]|uniref:PQQ-dependent sugar dehydrogenase n=1 Tax=Sphingomonas sp. TaxID=28214 RepID=UPI003CC55EA4
MRRLILTALALAACTSAQEPAALSGRANMAPAATRPFVAAPVAQVRQPFALAFLPDGRLLVTEKGGVLKLVEWDGRHPTLTSTVANVPEVAVGGQGGLLDVAVAPDFPHSHMVYLSYAEPRTTGSSLALARAVLYDRPECVVAPCGAELRNLQVIWRAGSDGQGGQFGATIAFAPDGRSLFLASGERQRFTPAQDPDQALGKIVHLTLDGRPAPDNPGFGRTGASVVGVIDPPRDTAAAATAQTREWRSPGPNTAPAATWSSGHRNPYGLAFDVSGRLWEVEMGPRGGDELNLIRRGGNYGWPRASNGSNYDGVDIPDHRPDGPDADGFVAPKAWWNPSISPGGMIIYSGTMFPGWRGSALIAALSGKALIRVALNGERATPAEQWDMNARLRDVAQAPDGAVWLLEDGERGSGGRLLRLTPTSP